jgi:hypothetical protein
MSLPNAFVQSSTWRISGTDDIGLIQLLPAGFTGASYRATDATIFSVAEGAGSSCIGGKAFEWRMRDVFVVPSWRLSIRASRFLVAARTEAGELPVEIRQRTFQHRPIRGSRRRLHVGDDACAREFERAAVLQTISVRRRQIMPPARPHLRRFLLDLGLDREDPRTGMIAFRDGVERRIDYATVGDRLFVNNVSLGVYATIVQQEGYREAKRETTDQLLPELLGRQAEPFDLQFTGPAGAEVDGAFVILVSNNPYVLGPALDLSQRRRLDSGTLGVVAVTAKTGAEAAAMITRSTVGLAHRDPNIHQFTAKSFEVRSRSGRAFAGIDGESLDLDTPLEFRIHPRGLRVLVPEESLATAAKRSARGLDLGDLVAVARGRQPSTVRHESLTSGGDDA